MTIPNRVSFLDVHTDIDVSLGDIVVKNQQVIDSEFVAGLRDERMRSTHSRAGEFHRVASIPTLFVNEMMKEGLDVYKAPIKDIVAWLKKRNLTDFLTSNKKV